MPDEQSSPNQVQVLTREQIQEKFRRSLREADTFIRQKNFAEAKSKLAEAKALEPSNPYIAAFTERILILEKEAEAAAEEPPPPPPPAAQAGTPSESETGSGRDPGALSGANGELERQIREQLEAEYKAKFTEELRKAELAAAKALEDERAMVEQQRLSLKARYETEIEEMKKRSEEDYRKRLGEEIAGAEQRLREQFQTERSFIEQELKAKLADQHEHERRQLEERLRAESDTQLNAERLGAEERERKLKEQFDKQMLEALRKTEHVFQEQNKQLQGIEQDKLRNQLKTEFDAQLARERDTIKSQYEESQRSLRESFAAEQQRMKEEHESELKEKLELLQMQSSKEIEKTLKAQIAKQYDIQLQQAKDRMERERNEHITREREKFQDRERKMEEEFEIKLHTALRSTESQFKEMTRQQLEAEQGKLKKQLEEEFRQTLEREQEETRRREEEARQQYALQLAQEQKRLKDEHKKEVKEQIDRVRKQETEDISRVMQEQLAKQHALEIRQLEERMQAQQKELIDRERESFQGREREMKEQFDRQLLESLRKMESVIQEQSRQQQEIEQQKLRKKLSEEFEARITSEREGQKQLYEDLKLKLQQSLADEQRVLKEQYQRQVEEQIAALRRRDEDEFERKRLQMLNQLEEENRMHLEQRLAEERVRLEQEAERALEREKERLSEEFEQRLKSQAANIQQIRSELKKDMELAFISRLEKVALQYDHKMELLGLKFPETREESMEVYRQKMLAAYSAGQPSVDEAKRLMELKEILGVTFDDHFAIEADVRLELYVQSVEKKILNGELNLKDTTALEDLKQAYNIAPDQAAKLEPYILSSFQRLAIKGKILIADDDVSLLKVLEMDLTSKGYQTVACESVQDAIEKLSTVSVDLILSDIKFGPGEPDGFKFFASVQERPHLRKIPFIFISALNDGVFVRSGAMLGADDYLTKPLDLDLLMAVIEGKLKRFRQMQK